MPNDKMSTGTGEIVFIALQTDKDTLNFPLASDTVVLIDPPEGDQKPIIAENTESSDTLGKNPGEFAGFDSGTLKLNMNFKTSGSAGVLSPLHALLLSWYGNHIVNAGVNVEYKHYVKDQELNYLTVLVKKSLSTELYVGAVATDAELTVTRGKILTIPFSLVFEKMYRAGTATLSTAITTATTAIELETKEQTDAFDVGSYIYVGTDTNSGAGHLVETVNKSTKTLTVASPGVSSQAAGATVAGYAPTRMDTGEDIVSRHGKTEITTGETPITYNFTESKLTVKNGIKATSDIIAWHDFPQIVSNSGKRDVTFSTTRYFGVSETQLKKHRNSQTSIPITLFIGKEPGNSIEIVLLDVRFKEVTESGKEEKKAGITGDCFQTAAGNDESILRLK